MTATDTQPQRNPSNRLGLDYAAEAKRLGPPVRPIIDVHSHISGERASLLQRRAMDLYGIERIYTMSPLEEVERLQSIFGERMRFIAVPNYWASDNRRHHMGEGYAERIAEYHALGARIVKFWSAPRATDIARDLGEPDFMKLDAPHRLNVMQKAADLGMMFMTHIGDPDTWFKTRYADASVYGTHAQQYDAFERVLERFNDRPWIAAHMGGWPENLPFLDRLLDRHDHLYLDTSATKWMVRELSKHPREELIAFFRQWKGRILFGSDIVTSDAHLKESEKDNEMTKKASSEAEAFDLYASRYWALRTMFETEYDGESPIADPDLAMVEPEKYDADSAPRLVGHSLPKDVLESIYRDTADAVVEAWLQRG